MPPLEKDDLEAFRSDVKHEVKSMNDATVRHVEKLIAPFTPLVTKVNEIEKHTLAQTPMLMDLKAEAGLAKKARAAAKKERVKRSALDENWRKWRKRIGWALATLVAIGEAYHAFLK